MVTSLPKVYYFDDVCVGFSLGKQHQDPFPKEKGHYASSPLELVHSDLMIFPHPSFIGAWYTLTFIDYLSRHTWVYFCKNKSDIFAQFKLFKVLIDN